MDAQSEVAAGGQVLSGVMLLQLLGRSGGSGSVASRAVFFSEGGGWYVWRRERAKGTRKGRQVGTRDWWGSAEELGNEWELFTYCGLMTAAAVAEGRRAG